MAPIIYMIRHGEKPPKKDGKDQIGLSSKGKERAHYLPHVFGSGSPYEIGRILAEKPKSNGERERPFKTVEPLAESLYLEIQKIDKDNAHEAAEAAKDFPGPGNVLICWEHGELTKIADKIGVTGFGESTGLAGQPVVYPDDHFDLIWVVPPPYNLITDVWSERVPGLDVPAIGLDVPGIQLPDGNVDGDQS
ncbi:hypothetical protein TWF694_009297 [Orbilia ellipsospora]|uniref:Phosphoglycerate mutase family protein n=1 Tax=Orbilia ellipsospora TaxID=2528407 RepID=A0AAV9XFX9_9PEZI